MRVKGEVITDNCTFDELVHYMTGGRFYFGDHSPYNPIGSFWGCPLISGGEVITDAERMDDLIEVMTGDRNGFEGMGGRLSWGKGALLNYGN